MRHRNIRGRFNRRTSWRKATLKSLTNDLLMHQRIETTFAKAKALRSFAEPLITLAKNNPSALNARRRAYQKLSNRASVKILFEEIAPLYKDIKGGYTRIMSMSPRKGDGASMAVMELTKRTVSDEELLGVEDLTLIKGKKPKRIKKIDAGKKDTAEKEIETIKKESALEPAAKSPHSALETAEKEKEKHLAEERNKEKAKTEDKKTRSIFRRIFRRKSMG